MEKRLENLTTGGKYPISNLILRHYKAKNLQSHNIFYHDSNARRKNDDSFLKNHHSDWTKYYIGVMFVYVIRWLDLQQLWYLHINMCFLFYFLTLTTSSLKCTWVSWKATGSRSSQPGAGLLLLLVSDWLPAGSPSAFPVARTWCSNCEKLIGNHCRVKEKRVSVVIYRSEINFWQLAGFR